METGKLEAHLDRCIPRVFLYQTMIAATDFTVLESHTLKNDEETRQLAGWLFQTRFKSRTTSILLLEGEMGMGKTTFTSGFGPALGIKDIINSPTFNILNRYDGSHGILYHYDFYRLRSAEDIFEMGLPEYWESENLSPLPTIHVMEWWERAASLLENIRPLFLIKFDSTGPDFDDTRYVEFCGLT